MVDIKGFRKANNLTQQAVADYLGIKKAFVCQIETGRHSLPSKHLEKLLNNTEGWDTTLLRDNETKFGLNIETSTDSPADVMVISQQVLDEMTAQRQLAEQALALVQEQLEIKQETIRTTQEQLTTSQEQLTTEQKQTSTAQMHTTAALEESRQSRKQVDELIIMLKNSEIKLEREMEKMERRIEELANKRMEHDDDRGHSHKAHNKNDA